MSLETEAAIERALAGWHLLSRQRRNKLMRMVRAYGDAMEVRGMLKQQDRDRTFGAVDGVSDWRLKADAFGQEN